MDGLEKGGVIEREWNDTWYVDAEVNAEVNGKKTRQSMSGSKEAIVVSG